MSHYSIQDRDWYQDTSVTNGQVYYYRVTADNSVGEGPSSNIDSAKPGIDRIAISPDPRSVMTGGQVQFSAVARAESGEIVQGVSFSWTTSVPGASISSAGLFKAGSVVGTFTEEVSFSRRCEWIRNDNRAGTSRDTRKQCWFIA